MAAHVEYIKAQATQAYEHNKEASDAVKNISNYKKKVAAILSEITNNRSLNQFNLMEKKRKAIEQIKKDEQTINDYEESAKRIAKNTAKYAEQANKSLIENDPDVSTYRDFVTSSNNRKVTLEIVKNNAERTNNISKITIDKYRNAENFLKDSDINDIILSINVIITSIISNNMSYTYDKIKYTDFIKNTEKNKGSANHISIAGYKREYDANIELAEKYLNETNTILSQIIIKTLDFVINNYKYMIKTLSDEHGKHNKDNIKIYNTFIENNKNSLDSILTSDYLNREEFKDVKKKNRR
jgi:hypothetical protein